MDEDITVINTTTRNEKIKNFFIKNKKKIVILISIIILLFFSYFIYEDLKKNNKIKLADKYNNTIMNFISGNKLNVEIDLVNIIKKNDTTYSPLALYFLIDNNIINERKKITELFDIVITKTNLEKEIKNLIIYKKALFHSDFDTENNLIQILRPVVDTDSIWKSHALYLMAEYFYSNNEKKKAREFFDQIIILKNINVNIKKETQKRLSRDFSE